MPCQGQSAHPAPHPCQREIKTFAPFGSNMRSYHSTYNCFVFLFFFLWDENMFISFLPLICLLSARCQSLNGCSSSEVTLTLTWSALLYSDTPAYQCPDVVAPRCELMYSGCTLNFVCFSIESVKLLSSGRKDLNNANRICIQSYLHGISTNITGDDSVPWTKVGWTRKMLRLVERFGVATLI